MASHARGHAAAPNGAINARLAFGLQALRVFQLKFFTRNWAYIIYSDDIASAMSVTLHTSLGDVKIEIFCEFVPKTAKNFLALCASNYYDDTIFHRNIRGFMIQGGDPTGTGKGGKSIYTTHASGKFEDEIVDSLKHSKRGIVSMANSGPNTNGSQFFITYKQHAHLNGKYTVFGHVIDGLDTLDKMERVPTGPGDRPIQEIRLQSVTIHANPLAA